MDGAVRKFGLLLPLRGQGGCAVPTDVVGRVIESFSHQFGVAACTTQVVTCRDAALLASEQSEIGDDLLRLFVDVPDHQSDVDCFRTLVRAATNEWAAHRSEVTTYLIEYKVMAAG